MRILLCDQDEEYLQTIAKRITKVSLEELTFETYTDVQGAMRRVEVEEFDMAFLGEGSDGKSGFDLGYHIKEEYPDCLIFYICENFKHLNEQFRVGAFQMLLKNKQDRHLEREFLRGVEKIHQIHFSITMTSLDTGEELNVIPSEIYYILTDHNELSIVTTQGKFRVEIENLVKVKHTLNQYHFFQVHPSYFVNLTLIRSIRTGELGLKNGDIVPVSQMNERFIERAIQRALRLILI